MLKRMKELRVSAFASVLAIVAVACIVGSAGAGNADVKASDPSAREAGTYQFTVVFEPKDKVLEAFLLDTRTGAVYEGKFNQNSKKIMWHKYVEPEFEQQLRW